MKLKLLTISLLLLFISLDFYAQSIYQFKYNYNTPSNNTNYDAFFFRYSNGEGFMRVRYIDAVSKQQTIAEMLLDEEEVVDAKGKVDESKRYLITKNAIVIDGNDESPIDTPIILFVMNPKTKLMEPKSLIFKTSNGAKTILPTSTFSATFLLRKDVSSALLKTYFNPQDEFVKNFYEKATRGVKSIDKTMTMHLIIVANKNAHIIGKTCEYDKNRAFQMYDEIRKNLGIQLKTIIISGDNYTKANVQKTIRQIAPKKNDIVVFYYSGHGFRKNDGKKFPYLDLRFKEEEDFYIESLNIEDIYNDIVKKGARLNLVFSDCCNCDVIKPKADGKAPMANRSSGFAWNQLAASNLFLNTQPMSILATAAESGQMATCNGKYGGFFSYYFKASLDYYTGSPQAFVTWYQVFDDAKKQTINKANHTYCAEPNIAENICKQFPNIKIN